MKNNKDTFYENKETKKIFFISLFVLIIAIFTFTVVSIIYSNAMDGISLADESNDNITKIRSTNLVEISQVSSIVGKTVDESKQEENEERKIAVNTSKMIKDENENIEKEESNDIEEKINEEVEAEKVQDPRFVKPLDGKITVNYAKDNLVYSNTLGEWITHKGIDIEAPKTTVVKAAEDGTIKSIKSDPRYGTTIVIEHVNGFESVYSNLLSTEFVKEGEKVKKEQGIGTVGNSSSFEIADEPHLHFEILKDGENLDPNLYI